MKCMIAETFLKPWLRSQRIERHPSGYEPLVHTYTLTRKITYNRVNDFRFKTGTPTRNRTALYGMKTRCSNR